VTTLSDINDIRNGIFVGGVIHMAFDERHAAVLKVCHICLPACPLSDPYVATNAQTPNPILEIDDIPPCYDRELQDGVIYPRGSRYTFQWLLQPDPSLLTTVRNNTDATFKMYTKKPKPSALLLHYQYGATAIKRWGRGKRVLRNLAHPPRPGMPVPAPTGPSRTRHDRTSVLRKLDIARNPGGANIAGAGTGGLAESEGQAVWDEDDAMLFLWGNSPAAKERRLKRVGENTQRVEQWREGVPLDSV
jgi:hypothetical protein